MSKQVNEAVSISRVRLIRRDREEAFRAEKKTVFLLSEKHEKNKNEDGRRR